MFHRLFDDPGQLLLPGFVVGVVTLLALSYRQRMANVGRTADVDDALLSTAGAVVGWLAWRSLARFRTRA